MKKNYLLLAAFMTAFMACNKDVVTADNAPTVSLSNSKILSGKEKAAMTNSISNDPLFEDYLKSLIDIQKSYAGQYSQIKNYDAAKSKKMAPKNEAELINGMRSLGFSSPETLIAKYKEANAKLARLYEKYPSFSKSMTSEEKKEFFKEATSKFYKNEK